MYTYHSYKKNSRKTSSRGRNLYSKKRIKHYEEPLFSKQKNSSRSKSNVIFKKYFKNLILGICILAGIATLIYLPYFRIKKITSQGFKNISQHEVELFVKSFIPENSTTLLPKNNFFLVNTEKIEMDAKKKFPLQNIFIKKQFPDSLSIQVEERENKAIIFTGDSYFLIDEQGFPTQKLLQMISHSNFSSSTSLASASEIIPTATSSPLKNSSQPEVKQLPTYSEINKEYKNLPIIFFSNETTTPFEINSSSKQIFSPEFISGINVWKDELEKRKIANIKYFLVNNTKAGADIFLDKAWKIQMIPENDFNIQFENLQSILKNFSPQEYVDLRQEGRVYWK